MKRYLLALSVFVAVALPAAGAYAACPMMGSGNGQGMQQGAMMNGSSCPMKGQMQGQNQGQKQCQMQDQKQCPMHNQKQGKKQAQMQGQKQCPMHGQKQGQMHGQMNGKMQGQGQCCGQSQMSGKMQGQKQCPMHSQMKGQAAVKGQHHQMMKQSTSNQKKAQIKTSTQVQSAVCPVMGNKIPDVKKAAGKSVYKGKTYYFCCSGCKPLFDKDPEKYIH